MHEGCGGVGILGVGGEEAAVGCFGGGRVVGGFGEFAGEENVVGGLGGEFEGSEEFVGGAGGVGLLVEAGEGSVGTGAEDGIAFGDGGGGS